MPRTIVALIFLLLLPAIATAQTGLVKAEKNLPMRTEPKAKAAVVEQLQRFQPVKILDRKDNWAKVKTVKLDPALSKEGWVLASYLSSTGFLTVERDKLSVRQGPGANYPTVLIYNETYPVFVRDIAPNGWVLVLDADGDEGWVPPSGLTFTPRYVVTKTAQCNIRAGGGKDYEKFPVAFVAEKGVYLQVVEEQDGWLHVKHEDESGVKEGWISTKIVFGWSDEEKAGPKTPAKPKKAEATKAKSEKTATKTSAKTSTAKKTESAAKSSKTSTKSSGKTAAAKTSTKSGSRKTAQ